MGLDWYDGARMLQGKQGKCHMVSGRRLVRGNEGFFKVLLFLFCFYFGLYFKVFFFFGGCTLSPMSVVFLRVFYTVTSFKEASGDIGFPLFAAIHCVASSWFFWSFLSFFGFHASSSEGKC